MLLLHPRAKPRKPSYKDMVVECSTLCDNVDDDVHGVLHQLELDIAKAKELTKPAWGFINRRGQIRFAIIQTDSKFVQELKLSACNVSAVPLTGYDLTYKMLEAVFGLVRSRMNVRINGLEEVDGACEYGTERYFKFHIDMEAA